MSAKRLAGIEHLYKPIAFTCSGPLHKRMCVARMRRHILLDVTTYEVQTDVIHMRTVQNCMLIVSGKVLTGAV